MKELYSGEEPRAVCYLREEGNSNHMLELTSARLVINQKGKEYEFFIDAIQKLTFNHRKQILLVIFGGITVPLATVALFGNLLNPLILLLFIFGGLFGFYIGWTGSAVLTVNLIGGHHDFLIHGLSQNLVEFVDFANDVIRSKGGVKLLFYVIIQTDQTVDEMLQRMGDRGKTRLYTKNMLIKNVDNGLIFRDQLCVGIDPFRADVEIKYEKSGEGGGMEPFIMSKLIPEAIIRSGHVSEMIETA